MRSRSDRIIAFSMLLPSLIALGIFVYGFIFQAIQTSMLDWGENRDQPALSRDVVKTDIGTENYQTLMTNIIMSKFRNSLVNTLFFTVFFVLGCLGVGLGLALLLDQRVAGEGFFRTAFLFPMSLSFVVTGTIWRWMLQPSGGINILPQVLFGMAPIKFNWISSRDVILQFTWSDVPTYLTLIGLVILGIWAFTHIVNRRWTTAGWIGVGAVLLIAILAAGLWEKIWLPLDDPKSEPLIAPKGFNTALTGVIIAAIWQMSGYTMAMFLAGIRGIPEELREAARVDGCTEVGVYTRIVLPQMQPIVLSAIIILGHISLKIFDLVFVMAGKDNAQTIVPGVMVYDLYGQNRYSMSSAVAIIMLFGVALVIVPYLWYSLRESKES